MQTATGKKSRQVKPKIELTHDEIRRYARHIIMPEMGLDGQRKLKAASVLVVGTGGLGSPTALPGATASTNVL